MEKIAFDKAGFSFEITEIGSVDRYGSLFVKGTVNGKEFTGKYRLVSPTERGIEFHRPLKIGGKKVGGVIPVGDAKDILDRILDEGRADLEAAAQAYREARPQKVTLVVGQDTFHIYVFPEGLPREDCLPEGTRNKVAAKLERRLEEIGPKAFDLLRQGEQVETGLGTGYMFDTDVLEAAIAALERPQPQPEPAPQPQPEPDQDQRPIVRLKRCWECGRLDIVDVPAGFDRKQVERWLDEAVDRAIAPFGGEPLAAAPLPPDDDLPVRFRVVRQWYCGC